MPVTSRQSYAGLKILPTEAYEKLQVFDEAKNLYQTHFRCKYI